MPKPPAFNPLELPESNATGYPPPHREAAKLRFNRRLGDHVGLTRYGVVLKATRSAIPMWTCT